jgi:sugar-specific transcriptional regulator TrmB
MPRPFNYQLFGLEPRDIAVYEAMLQSPGATSIRAVASVANQNRGTTFEIIKKLAEIGLIGSHYKNNRRYYFAKSPSALKTYAEEIQVNLTNEISRVDNYISKLKDTKAQTLSKQFTQFYDGEEEIAALLRDVLATTNNTKQKNYRVISSAEVRNHLYGKFRNFTRQRIKLGISVRVIGVGEIGSKARLAQTKLLTDQESPGCYIIIYGDKVAHISLSELMQVQGVLIQDEGISKLHSLMFDQLWNSL